MSNKRPQALPVQVKNIPAELKSVKQWCTWRYELRDGKWTKPPFQVSGAGAKTNDPETWAEFNVALEAYRNPKNRFDGIGFMFAPPTCGIDLDKVRDIESGVIEPWAAEIVASVNSYTELSPSQTGLHIIATGDLPKGGRKKGRFEIYNTGRCFTVTGAIFDGTPAAVESRDIEIKNLHAKIFGITGTQKASASSNSSDKALKPADKKLLQKAFTDKKSGKRIKNLYDGNVDKKKYGSPSEADFGLIALLSDFTQDPDQLDRLMRGSKLFSRKWDRPYSDGTTYLSRSIAKILEGKKSKAPNLDTWPYRIVVGRYVKDRQTKDTIVTDVLCNFTARIVEDQNLDDGSGESVCTFAIEGELDNGVTLPTVRIPSAKFAPMNWVTDFWGSRAVIRSGMGSRDSLREAIQRFSPGSRLRKIFTHTGWRQIDGEWLYLGGTAAGNADYEIDLGTELDRYKLPLIAEDPVEAMKASLKLLDITSLRVTAPLWAACYRAPLQSSLSMDLSLWLEGRTGSLKSTLAGLFMSHFGDFDRTHLPGAWSSTGNQLERRAFLLKDSLFVIDEWAPSPLDHRDYETKASRVLRSVGNQAGRGRLRSDLTERATFIPRSIVISTAEQHPTMASLLARILIVEVNRDEIDFKALTEAQEATARLSHAMKGYLDWLKPQLESMPKTLETVFLNIRKRVTRSNQHLRIPEGIAHLHIGVDCGLAYAEEIGAIDGAEAGQLRERCLQAFLELGETQDFIVEDQKPARRFLEILSIMLSQGRAVLAIKSPKDDEYSVEPKAGVDFIGWYDAEFLYLLPEGAYLAVNRFCRDSGESFPVREERLKQDLKKEGISICDEKRLTTTVNVARSTKRLLKLDIEKITQLLGHDILPTDGSYQPGGGQ